MGAATRAFLAGQWGSNGGGCCRRAWGLGVFECWAHGPALGVWPRAALESRDGPALFCAAGGYLRQPP